MADAIVLRGIEFLGVHGATAEERLRRQRFSVDVTLELDLARSARTDRLADTVDYGAIGEMVVEIGQTARYHLLEALASRIADDLQTRWPRASVTVAVRKVAPPVKFPVAEIEVRIARPARRRK